MVNLGFVDDVTSEPSDHVFMVLVFTLVPSITDRTAPFAPLALSASSKSPPELGTVNTF